MNLHPKRRGAPLAALASAFVALALPGCASREPAADAAAPTRQRTIVMVWDGLRPDSINPTDTPRLYALRQAGVNFTDHHATYPTFTMMNGAAFATGAYPKTSGFYGNTFWTPPQRGEARPVPVGRSAAGAPQSYADPVFTEDYAVLAALDEWYGGRLLRVKSLFQTAQEAGLSTVTLGKTGAAYLQDLGRGGLFVDENAVLPQSLAAELQAAGFPLPANAGVAYPAGSYAPAPGNGNPTARANVLSFALPNGVLARDPTDGTQGAPEDAANSYMLRLYTQYILPRKKPDLSVIWFRTPDSTEHAYGPGSANHRKALASQDARLGELQAALNANGLEASTNLVVVSDHAHSNVSGPTRLFPLRAITPGTRATGGTTDAALGAIDPIAGFSVSGDVRSADLLTHAGFKAFDGGGCATSPMAGIRADGTPVHPVRVDAAGTLCGTPGARYQAVSASLAQPVASFRVPAVLPAGAVVVAPNGGSDYFYVPDHDAATVAGLVRFLQSRPEFGAVFVDSRHGALPGTLPMAVLQLENAARRDRGQPDVVASFSWDAQQLVNGLPGTEYESFGGSRGMHGSFSPIDVHNTLVAAGPAFKAGFSVALPSANVDVAPTVARLLGLALPEADGRVLEEALVAPPRSAPPTVTASVINPRTPATGLVFASPVDPSGATIDRELGLGTYSIHLVVKDLSVGGRTYRYFDYAQAVRN